MQGREETFRLCGTNLEIKDFSSSSAPLKLSRNCFYYLLPPNWLFLQLTLVSSVKEVCSSSEGKFGRMVKTHERVRLLVSRTKLGGLCYSDCLGFQVAQL